jgi:hypothetical protein
MSASALSKYKRHAVRITNCGPRPRWPSGLTPPPPPGCTKGRLHSPTIEFRHMPAKDPPGMVCKRVKRVSTFKLKGIVLEWQYKSEVHLPISHRSKKRRRPYVLQAEMRATEGRRRRVSGRQINCVKEMRRFRLVYVGGSMSRERRQMSYIASLSTTATSRSRDRQQELYRARSRRPAVEICRDG